MGLTFFQVTGPHPRIFRTAISGPVAGSRGRIGKTALAGAALVFALIISIRAEAQQASQPGFDPRQTEKRFDEPQSGQSPSGRSTPLRVPALSRPEATADSTPLFDLHGISITGAYAIPHDQ